MRNSNSVNMSIRQSWSGSPVLPSVFTYTHTINDLTVAVDSRVVAIFHLRLQAWTGRRHVEGTTASQQACRWKIF